MYAILLCLTVVAERRFPQKTLFGFTASLRWMIIKRVMDYNFNKPAHYPHVRAPSPFNEEGELCAVRQSLEREMRRSFDLGVGVVPDQAPVISLSEVTEIALHSTLNFACYVAVAACISPSFWSFF